MKRLLFILLVLFSCEKDGSRDIGCYTCRWETKILSSGAYSSYIIDTCLLDVTAYEAEGTWQNTTKKSRVMCWKQGDPPLPNPGF